MFFSQVLTSNQNLIVIDWGGNKKTFLALPQASEKEKSKREKLKTIKITEIFLCCIVFNSPGTEL